MSDEQPTQTGDLGDQPEPEIEPGEPRPGGADALPDDDEVTPADLQPEDNPAVDEQPDPLKRVLSEREDTDTEATKASNGGDEDVSSEEDSPA